MCILIIQCTFNWQKTIANKQMINFDKFEMPSWSIVMKNNGLYLCGTVTVKYILGESVLFSILTVLNCGSGQTLSTISFV